VLSCLRGKAAFEVMRTADSAIRDVLIASPSMRRELMAVLRAAVVIVFGVWLYLVNSPFAAAGGDLTRRGTLAPFQAFVRDRSPEEQRMFRELQVALLEAETIRSTEGEWPDAARMAAEGIEPFAPNPTLKGARYTWRELRDGRFVNYLGVPDRAGASSWLVLVQEPDPAAPEAFTPDEEHHQLVDGSVLHVSIWTLPPNLRAPQRIARAPQFEGWTQLFAVAPSAMHTGVIAPPSPAP
jgi:hypothetical protein